MSASCVVCFDLLTKNGKGYPALTIGITLLRQSADYCLYCSVLWKGLTHFNHEIDRSIGPSLEVSLTEATYTADTASHKGGRLGIAIKPNPVEGPLKNLVCFAESPVSAEADIFGTGRRLFNDTDDAESLTQIVEWIQTCDEVHLSCRSPVPLLPTRVLDVSRDQGMVYLHETASEERGRYVSLSYCWGGTIPIVTSSNNLHLHREGIAMAALPLTFREAVSVAKKLGCQYLWIDALCIIQDSREDWATEAGRMAGVYGNSYVTLVAAASTDSTGGLFEHHRSQSASYVVQSRAANGGSISVRFQPDLNHQSYLNADSLFTDRIRAPWLKRAWCYQEFLLSCRALVFTEYEVIWTCREQSACNCGKLKTRARPLNEAQSRLSQFPLRSWLLGNLETLSGEQLSRLWWMIVESYAKKDLTFSSDRLAALAGIAERLSTGNKSDYINGLWEKNLVKDLHWRTSVTSTSSRDPAMPSWSWISVDGTAPILGPTPFKQDVEGQPNIEIMELVPHHVQSNPWTSVTIRSLVIRGHLLEIELNKFGLYQGRSLEILGVLHPNTYKPDVRQEYSGPNDHPWRACLLLTSTKARIGLVLEPVDGETDTYRRLGLWHELDQAGHQPDPTSLFNASSLSTIKLV